MENERLLFLFDQQKRVSTDTRQLRAGDIYFALRGPRFNGNAYAAQALEAGAAYAVIDDPAYHSPRDPRYVLVDDTLTALQDLARTRRRALAFPIFGITGSNGKTTSKELVASVLSTERRVFATRGNLNNHIGVPLTLLAIPEDTDIAIIEMGANKPGDIAELAHIAEPTHGLITNVGYAHIEQLGDLDGVRRTKGALFDFVGARHGTLFVNAADPHVVRAAAPYAHHVRYGTSDADFHLELLQNTPEGMQLRIHSHVWDQPLDLTSQLTGAYNAHNILAAVAVGQHFGTSRAGIQAGIFRYNPDNNRSQLLRRGDYTIWLDAYNANPSSMRASIQNIFNWRTEGVVLILGDMLELGEAGPTHHRALGEFINTFSPAAVIGIGPLMQDLVAVVQAPAYWAASIEAAAPHLIEWIGGAHTLLLKGSRGIALERLLDHLPA
ncbi:MAG: UDP-N-acetylmuramoyl-tripeptide--D-alanyl-D-alanine ligase [Bacteroidia bacterium]